MEMIKVAMRDIDRVDVEEIRRDLDRLRIVPPGSPIGGADQPRIDKYSVTFVFDEHASVAENAERERHTVANRTIGASCEQRIKNVV